VQRRFYGAAADLLPSSRYKGFNMRDLARNLSPTRLIAPAVATADTTPISVDLLGFDSCAIVLDIGAGGITFDGTNRIDFVLQHSDDNSTFTNVTSVDVVGAPIGATITSGIVRSLTAAKAAADTVDFSYVGGRRYIRFLADFSGTHGTGTQIGAWAVRGHPHIAPTA